MLHDHAWSCKIKISRNSHPCVNHSWSMCRHAWTNTWPMRGSQWSANLVPDTLRRGSSSNSSPTGKNLRISDGRQCFSVPLYAAPNASASRWRYGLDCLTPAVALGDPSAIGFSWAGPCQLQDPVNPINFTTQLLVQNASAVAIRKNSNVTKWQVTKVHLAQKEAGSMFMGVIL